MAGLYLTHRERAIDALDKLSMRDLTFTAIVLALSTACSSPTAPTTPPTPPPVLEIVPPYNRDDWPHWIDADHDCQDTRQEVLIDESLSPVRFTDARQCRVVAGTWRDAYSGLVYGDPSALDIDHLVPLENAHRSGGWRWTTDRKRDYANDLVDRNHLVAVHRSLNRQKGSQTPATWRPPDRAAWCAYALAWIGVKARWTLSISADEQTALRQMQVDCP